MPYVDLRSREREERARGSLGRTGLWHSIRTNPSILIAAGFAFGVAVSSIFLIPATGEYEPLARISALVFLLLIVMGIRQPRQDRPGDITLKIGGEKQLLMAIQRSGGGITPVEAALETSLTVDEAEQILSRFASKGHLRVESLDGSLYYSLPERRGLDDTG